MQRTLLSALLALTLSGFVRAQEGCLDNDDCTDPDYPYCYEGLCVECITDDGCPGYSDFCDGEEVCINNECWETPAGEGPCSAGVGDCEDGCDEQNDECTCTDDCDCDDGLYCNGEEQCVSGVCQPGIPPHPYELCDEINDEGVNSCLLEKFLTASNAGSFDGFGRSVGIEGDYVVVGAYLTDGANFNEGSAYMLYKDAGGTGNWGEQAEIKASDPEQNQFFGYSASITQSGSDHFVVVGAPQSKVGTQSNAGAAYVFERSGTNWTQQVKVTAGVQAAAQDEFGTSVAISGDYVVVGVPYDDDAGSSSGSAYVFYRDQGGSGNWGQQAKLTASDAAAGDQFGFSVAISGDYILVGARWDDWGSYTDGGSAYLFKRDGATWPQFLKLTAADPAADDEFGYSVSIDGDYAAIGARLGEETGGGFGDTGAVHVFYKDEGGTNNWGEQAELHACDPEQSSTYFGWSVAIKGGHIAVGTPSGRAFNVAPGKAYLFERDGADWTLERRLIHPAPKAADKYGHAVAVSDDHVLVGAYEDDIEFLQPQLTGAGSAILYGTDCPLEIVHGDLLDWTSFEEHAFSGYIDPRRESDDGINVNQGMNQFVIFFSQSVRNIGGDPLSTGAFVVTETGAANPPTVTNVSSELASPCGDVAVTVVLSRIITLQEWTTIEANVETLGGIAIPDYGNLGVGNDEPDRIDVGFLPCDVDQGGRVLPRDWTLFRQIYIDEDYPLPRGTREDRIDINRNGHILPEDLTLMRTQYIGAGSATRQWLFQAMGHDRP